MWNKFELELREKLSKFTIAPSDEVWDKIAPRITKPKRIVPWGSYLRVASVFVTAILIYVGLNNLADVKMTINNVALAPKSTTENSNVEKAITQNTVAKNTFTERKNDVAEKNNAIASVAKKANNRNINLLLPSVVSREMVNNKVENKNIESATDINTNQHANETLTQSDKQIVANTDDEVLAKNNLETTETNLVANETLSPSAKMIADKLDGANFNFNKKFDVATVKPNNLNDISSINYLPDNLYLPVNRKTYENSSFAIGTKFSLGISSLQHSLFKKSNDRVFDANAALGTSNNRLNRLLYYSGPSFLFGLITEKRVSSRSSFSTGVEFSFLSDKIGTSWTNVLEASHFYFLSIPINYQLRVNNSRFSPLYWSVGLLPGAMVYTTGLIYQNNYGGILFKSPSSFNYFNLSASTGIYFQPTTNVKRNIWRIGAEFKTSITPLQSEATNQRNYFIYGGVSAQYFFKLK